MKSYIFIATQGGTFQPDSQAIEPDIENCQVIGFAQGQDEEEAFAKLVNENPWLLETTFDELICFELRHSDYFEHRTYFHLNDLKPSAKC